MKTYFIPQLDQSDCGFACLKMLIASYYENENALFIKQNENHGPYSFQQLLEKGGDYGLTFEGILVEDKKEIKEMKFPFIALLEKKNGLHHYVLVTKCKLGTVYYLDSNEGECFASIKTFSSLWTGKSLIVTDFTKKEDIVFPEYEVKKKNTFVPIYLLQFFSALLLIVGIFFIDEKTKIYIPLAFLGASVIFEILLRIILVKKMEKFDYSYLSGLNVDKNRYYDFYVRLEDYKKKLFSSRMNIIFSFVIILFIAAITLYNNVYNAFIILIPLLLAVIDVKLVETSLKEKDELIVLDEREINDINNIDLLKSQINKLHMRSYKMAKVVLLKRYIYMALLIVTALLTTVFNESFALPYVIFYFAIGYTLFEQFENFIHYPDARKELLRSRARLYNVTERI